jgi:hypothetical protein
MQAIVNRLNPKSIEKYGIQAFSGVFNITTKQSIIENYINHCRVNNIQQYEILIDDQIVFTKGN